MKSIRQSPDEPLDTYTTDSTIIKDNDGAGFSSTQPKFDLHLAEHPQRDNYDIRLSQASIITQRVQEDATKTSAHSKDCKKSTVRNIPREPHSVYLS